MCLGAETTRLLVWSVVNFATNLPLNLLLFPNYLLYIFWWLPRRPLQHLNICYVTLFSGQILLLENTKWEGKVRKMLNKNMCIAGPKELSEFEHVPAYRRISVWRAVCLFPEFTLACVHYSMQWDTRWRSWLRHCATSRKIAFPMISLEFFVDIILPAALWSIQTLTEMSTRNIYWELKAASA